ncbi:histone acetylation protein-domain-containing protein [Clohesyomyces aquaticus]|uniref:histone acetyltransferase n=1 Tax=Clohesyomyces aquaticus TaxID=1231657 RepID=A0A1Y2AAD5_9PLEO|nr:histone acetylation protein-domain-containing protein [Clohesyomyces aquaticus]
MRAGVCCHLGRSADSVSCAGLRDGVVVENVHAGVSRRHLRAGWGLRTEERTVENRERTGLLDAIALRGRPSDRLPRVHPTSRTASPLQRAPRGSPLVMANTNAPKSLQDLLAEALPKDVPFTFYHYSTPPSSSPALFSAAPNRKPEKTYCESHFLAVSIAPREGGGVGASGELLILAIEILIYSTKRLTTIFVSKADSTGSLHALNLPRSQAGSPLKSICGIFVSWLARERQREGKKLVVSLFARAQDQYLFPASIDNANKHVLDDRGLVKWWCRVLDPLVRSYAPETEQRSLTERLQDSKDKSATDGTVSADGPLPNNSATARGHLIIPGFDLHETLRYIPPSPSPTEPRRWSAAHPLLEIAPHAGAPPRCLVPHFPDDPKSRYLDELDEELPDRGSDAMTKEGGTPSRSNGQWKSIKTLEQFWEMMAFRQECSSGRIVGFIWVVITPPKASIPEEDEDEPSQSTSQTQSQGSFSLPISPAKKQPSPKKPRRRPINTESGPIPLRLPRIKSNISNLSTNSSGSANALSKLPPESTAYFKWPPSSRGSLLLSKRDYDRANEILLQQNFATQTAAAKSSKRWKDEIAVLAGAETWGWTVVGRKEVAPLAGSATNGITPVTVIGVRKKRKTETENTSAEAKEIHGESGPKVLEEGLVRKKVKVEESSAVSALTNGVNTLSAGLVRKKPRNP